MTGPVVRQAGRGRRADGAVVTWTIADGHRGRRWRESVVLDGHLVYNLLYETGPDRRFAHLELASPLGLVTLHPEGDGTLHGNIVRADGVEHIAGLASAPGDALLVMGSPIAAAAVAWVTAGTGDARAASVVELDPANLSLQRRDTGAIPATFAIDTDGAPQLTQGATWPLEHDDDA